MWWTELSTEENKMEESRAEWVYDSGCLHCHENLIRGTKPNKKAFIAHKAYFSKKLLVDGEDGKKENAKCVDCHKHVGHYQLEKHLPEPPDEYGANGHNWFRALSINRQSHPAEPSARPD